MSFQRAPQPAPTPSQDSGTSRPASPLSAEKAAAPPRTLGSAAGRHEEDADRIARQIVRQDAPFTLPPALRRTEGLSGEPVTPDVEASLLQTLGGGQPLPAPVRAPMEKALGMDFSQVKVHTDARADTLSRSLQARAFTTGRDLFFRQGEYDSRSPAGQQLIAHELAHVAQQAGNPAPPIQRQEYLPQEAKPPAAAHVGYSQVTVKGVTTPRRMEARGLSKKTIGGGTKRPEKGGHSALYTQLLPVYKNDTLHDMHLLHVELGGKGEPFNLVPAPQETNNNMMDFEQMVISRVKQTSTEAAYRVVDYEVGVNYGRSGKGVEAAMPTSLDLRMTEQKTENKGASWIDDGPSLVRNLAVQPKTVFAGNQPGEDKTLGKEGNDPTRPLLAPKNPFGRIQSSEFASTKTTAGEVAPSALYYFKDYGLISDKIEDPRYKWSKVTLDAYVQGHVAAHLRHLRGIVDRTLAKLVVPEDLRQKLAKDLDARFKGVPEMKEADLVRSTQKELAGFLDKGGAFGSWPTELLREFEGSPKYALFWPGQYLDGLTEKWYDLELAYKEHLKAEKAQEKGEAQKKDAAPKKVEVPKKDKKGNG